ncbi:carbohydrate ABC transporter permease [Quadrisphaera sp. DSM 44207]|uniref:carbohydrate ABC transporter permease n=1 Tax=Quadrisphaera sp. DSM 44207 TaxID=1881057 RepID=UPI000887F844|nr:sugar ABC transporter permease [Quadrisphaera sp. DSM 44207]SDQ64889.1 carbohydrate ABC transporter membrane protein 1, CUT1 family [Quadrisphaera sp. DSM 44207]
MTARATSADVAATLRDPARAADRAPARSAARPASGPQRRAPLSPAWRKRLEIAFFVAPALALLAVFVVVPVLQAVRYSTYSWNGLGPLDDFVGLENYATALRDQVFTDAVVHNLVIIVLSIAVQLPLGLAIALLLNREIRGRSALRVIIFVPYVLAEVVAGVVWVLLLQPGGLVDAVVDGVGLGGLTQLWLGDPEIALYTVMVVLTWKYLGLAVLLFLAGLQGVPEDLYEAAQLDGASWWQVQRRVTIPLLGPTIRTWGFLSMIGSLQLFDMVWILTGGGPANSTMTMATYLINQGTDRSLYGYASAVAVVLFGISLVLAVVYQFFVLRRDNEDAPRPRKAAAR